MHVIGVRGGRGYPHTQGQGIPQTFLPGFTEEFTDRPPSKGLLAAGIELGLGLNHKSAYANSTNPYWQIKVFF